MAHVFIYIEIAVSYCNNYELKRVSLSQLFYKGNIDNINTLISKRDIHIVEWQDALYASIYKNNYDTFSIAIKHTKDFAAGPICDDLKISLKMANELDEICPICQQHISVHF